MMEQIDSGGTMAAQTGQSKESKDQGGIPVKEMKEGGPRSDP